MILTPRARTCITLGACAVLGGGVLLHSSRWGLGLSPDSVVYIGAARSLLAGHGFTVPAESALSSPITHYPPVYSSLLAVTGNAVADPLDGAIWLNVAAFSISIYVSGFLLFAALGSWHLDLLGSLFTFTAFPLVQAYTMVWLEAFSRRKRAARQLTDTLVFAAIAVLPAALWGTRKLAPRWQYLQSGRSLFTRSVWSRSLTFPRCWRVGSLFGLWLTERKHKAGNQ